ncbi:MAG: carbohydrate ABC transporter permease [Christensenellales bacterium]
MLRKRNRITLTAADRAFEIFNLSFLALILLVTLVPFLIVIQRSLVPPEEVMRPTGGLSSLIPRNVTFDYYKYIINNPVIWHAYGVTVMRTLLGTFINLLLTVLTAYPLSKKNLLGNRRIMIFFFITMIFNGGMIPTYLLVTSLGLQDTIWALVLPSALSVYNMIIMRTFFRSLPSELEESARIDGCHDIMILFRIILPLSLPAVASVGLFYAVWHWNTFMDGVLYITDRKLWPLQILLRETMLTASMSELELNNAFAEVTPPAQGLISAEIIITMLPIICVYPFLQKHFVKGVLIGSIKG